MLFQNKRVVGGMLRVRLLCKVRNFSPITRSRGEKDAPPGLDPRLPPGKKKKKKKKKKKEKKKKKITINWTPEFTRGL